MDVPTRLLRTISSLVFLPKVVLEENSCRSIVTMICRRISFKLHLALQDLGVTGSIPQLIQNHLKFKLTSISTTCCDLIHHCHYKSPCYLTQTSRTSQLRLARFQRALGGVSILRTTLVILRPNSQHGLSHPRSAH